MQLIELLKSIFFGIVQGITEWLPISSTGHMLLFDELVHFNMSNEFKEAFWVLVQLGSIIAVIVLYWRKLNPFSRKKTPVQRKGTWMLWCKVLIASIPAGVIGLLFDDVITDVLYRYYVVAIALIVYGVLFVVLENRNRKKYFRIQKMAQLDYRTALFIGMFQMLALIPGTSRSGSTILGAMLLGVSRTVAAEFSFFMAIPAMVGASGYKLLKLGLSFSAGEWVVMLVGMLVAFVVSVLAIKFLMGYIRRHDFKAFGYYRIALGAIVLLFFLLSGANAAA